MAPGALTLTNYLAVQPAANLRAVLLLACKDTWGEVGPQPPLLQAQPGPSWAPGMGTHHRITNIYQKWCEKGLFLCYPKIVLSPPALQQLKQLKQQF